MYGNQQMQYGGQQQQYWQQQQQQPRTWNDYGAMQAQPFFFAGQQQMYAVPQQQQVAYVPAFFVAQPQAAMMPQQQFAGYAQQAQPQQWQQQQQQQEPRATPPPAYGFGYQQQQQQQQQQQSYQQQRSTSQGSGYATHDGPLLRNVLTHSREPPHSTHSQASHSQRGGSIANSPAPAAAASSVATQPSPIPRDLTATPGSTEKPLQLAAVANVTSKTQPHTIGLVAVSESLLSDPVVFEQFYALCRAREFGAWLHLTNGNPDLTRETLVERLSREFGSRLLLVVAQWGTKQPARFTGVVTCGPKSLGSDRWRLGAFFEAQHKVPLTLCILQLAVRFWYALDQRWPTHVTWRMPHGSIESRRIAETALIFHAKQHEHAASTAAPAAAAASSALFRNIRLEHGRVPFAGPRDPKSTPDPENAHIGEFFDLILGDAGGASSFLLDLATWGVGSARWVFYEQGSQPALFTAAFPVHWRGHVLHAANLPLSCRGFQHLPPVGRAQVLGPALYDTLDIVAMNLNPSGDAETDSARGSSKAPAPGSVSSISSAQIMAAEAKELPTIHLAPCAA